MNIYTVAKASQGLADYLKKNFAEPSVAIGYDSRIKSDVFAKVAAGVFAANGVKVNIWPVLMPVPTVSFATRYLHTSAGVMVTASHNPGKYNGYKVYGADGCQITTEAAAEILAEIEKLDIFADVKTSDFEAGVTSGNIHYGLRTINVLTGFKFIGEQIGKLEKQGRADSYVFGFEESYGYLTGSYVRDKDGVDGAYMICEMFSYYATKGISLLDKLDELYKTYGYCLNTLHSYEFDGSAGFAKMQSIMQAFRGNIKAFGGKKVVKLLDYAYGLDGLPKSEVLKFLLEDNCSIVVRPSGTEPKLKIYISVSAENREAAEKVECEIVKDAEKWFA